MECEIGVSYKIQIGENQLAYNEIHVVENQEWMAKIKLWRIMSQMIKITICQNLVVECQTGVSNKNQTVENQEANNEN